MSESEDLRVYHRGGGRRLVQQHEKDPSNINNIVRRWLKTGQVVQRQVRYGDFESYGDYHATMNRLVEAQEQFLALPAAVRDACRNDPGRFLDMVQDPEREAELRALGLLPEQVPEQMTLNDVVEAIRDSGQEPDKES